MVAVPKFNTTEEVLRQCLEKTPETITLEDISLGNWNPKSVQTDIGFDT